jgi:hypothetical protein
MDNKPVDEYPVSTTPPAPQSTTPTMESLDSSHDLAQDPSPASNEPFKLPIQPPKRSKKPLLIIVVALLLLIAAGVIYYFVVYTKPQAAPVASSTTTPTPKTTVSAQQIIDQVKAQKLQGTVLTAATSDATTAQTSDKMYIYSASFYQLPGKEFAANPEQAYGTGYHGSKQVETTDFQAIANYLTSHDFKSANYKYPADSTDLDPMYVNAATYVSSGVFCALRQSDYAKDLSGGSFKDNTVIIWCADLSSYKAVADKLQPFFTALTRDPKYKKSSDPLATTTLGNLKINDGVSGHKNATASVSAVGAIVGGAEGFFYQEPGKDWTYLIASQDGLYCKDLTSTAIKQAFSGQTCYDMTTQKTVQVASLL